jgi:hypothetical protein
MLILPADNGALLNVFAPLFSRRILRHVSILVVGAMLTPGERLVSSALRSVGLGNERRFQTYYRLLRRLQMRLRSRKMKSRYVGTPSALARCNSSAGVRST